MSRAESTTTPAAARRRTAAPKTDKAMCCVTIGYEQILLPPSKGQQLIELLANAQIVKSDFKRSPLRTVYVVQPGEFLNLNIELVRSGQVVEQSDAGEGSA